MKEDLSPKEWADEYSSFLSTSETPPPAQTSVQILAQVHRNMNPAPIMVFSKLGLIHGVVGTLTLLFCPQFGLSPLADIGLMHIFMRFGEAACMLGCGAVYMGASALAASALLRVEEIKVLRHTEALQIPLLGLFSIGVFICFGASIVFEISLIAWFFGSAIGGMATLELGWLVRSTLREMK